MTSRAQSDPRYPVQREERDGIPSFMSETDLPANPILSFDDREERRAQAMLSTPLLSKEYLAQLEAEGVVPVVPLVFEGSPQKYARIVNARREAIHREQMLLKARGFTALDAKGAPMLDKNGDPVQIEPRPHVMTTVDMYEGRENPKPIPCRRCGRTDTAKTGGQYNYVCSFGCEKP